MYCTSNLMSKILGAVHNYIVKIKFFQIFSIKFNFPTQKRHLKKK